MAKSTDHTEELTNSSLDLPRVSASANAILRCVDVSVLRGNTGEEIRLGTNEVTIGRGDDNSVPVHGIGVSRSHARIFFADDHWHVEDLGSTNGTRVNNSNVKSAMLNDGDTVAFGRVCYKFLRLDRDPRASSRQIDLGLDRTLILMPDGKPREVSKTPAGAAGGQRPERARERHSSPGETTARRKAVVAPQPAESSNLGSWIFILLAVLVGVVAGLVFIS